MKFQAIPLIAYLCITTLLVSLGNWQLNRAEEKRGEIRLQEQAKGEEVLTLSTKAFSQGESLIYKKVKAEGQFDTKHQFLLDNQINQSKAGYVVFTPFLLKGERMAVLVNRGWLPLGKSRNELPDISFESREIGLFGRINRFPGIGLKLAGAEIPTKAWPSVIQVVDSTVLAEKLGYPLLPFQVELDKAAPNGFVREWRDISTMPPEKHTAYAVQWFLLAMTLTVLFIKYGFKKHG